MVELRWLQLPNQSVEQAEPYVVVNTASHPVRCVLQARVIFVGAATEWETVQVSTEKGEAPCL